MNPIIFNITVQRELFPPDWITALMVFSLFLLVVLKTLNSQKFYGYLTSIVNKGFLEIQAEDRESPLNLFDFIFTLFSIIALSLGTFIVFDAYELGFDSKLTFLDTVTLVLAYFVVRLIAEQFLIRLFSLSSILLFYQLSKRSYLYSISLLIWVLILAYLYGNANIRFFLVACGFLFLVRIIVILSTNKNLIFSNLFYFILYLCAFEIAPLLVLFKLMIK